MKLEYPFRGYSIEHDCQLHLPTAQYALSVAESRQLGEDDLVVRLGLTQAYGAAAECSDASSGARNQAGRLRSERAFLSKLLSPLRIESTFSKAAHDDAWSIK